MNSTLLRTFIQDLKFINTRIYCVHSLRTIHLAGDLRQSIFGAKPSQKTFLNNDNKYILEIFRNYAKNKDKKKEKGKTKVVINEVQMAQLLNVDSIKTQMEHSIEQMKESFSKNLSLRSATGSIESLLVTLEGEDHTLQELGQISRKNPKLVVINMSTFPQAIPEVLKAIEKSGMNLNPQQDGTTLFIPIPKVTKEHRENLSKNAKQLFVKCKDSIREVQNRYSKGLKKKEGASEDLSRNIEQQLKALTDQYVSEAEQILNSKQKELLGD
ncbi:hypothetical protein WA026_018850 [Henosepilachna vigintioctopunctata]|uniref:Ribosome-recycling factor, mitochondrial n=1 Tax=Henosepilachna vigintioctopunctata TaxID=420089 RepID=A0AAW1UR66_9CUCU